MPARGLAPSPREYVVRGEWPDGQLQCGAPYEAQKAAAIANRLQGVIGDRSLRAVAALSGISIGTLHNLLTGKTWGDVVTIARLENALSTDLWSGSLPHLSRVRTNQPLDRKSASGEETLPGATSA